MLTFNEADHVAISVPPILSFVDEVVIIDGGSTDGTVDILRSFGEKIRVEVIPQGASYSVEWKQEERRQRLQELCRGKWIFQLDADEVVSDSFENIRQVLESTPDSTISLGVFRVDYAPDLYHAFLPYTAHSSIPRIWRKGKADWLTGKALHMTPYLAGTKKAIASFEPPTFVQTEHVLHHLHRAYWLGKRTHKKRSDEKRAAPMSRSSTLGAYKFAIERLPNALIPKPIANLRAGQKTVFANKLGVQDPFADFDPSGVECDAHDFFLPSNAAGLQSLIEKLPNPVLFIEIGSWLGASTRFLARHVGGCVVAIDHWLGSDEHRSGEKFKHLIPTLQQKFLANCWEYRDRILPIVRTSKEALELPLIDADLIYIDAAHDYESVLFDLTSWAPRLAPHGVLCGDDWLWGTDKPVQRAVLAFAEASGHSAKSNGNFWWVEPTKTQ